VVDEVEQPIVGELQILEQKDDRSDLRDALEERSPGGEQLLAAALDGRLDAQQD